jgi:hypothetical protein
LPQGNANQKYYDEAKRLAEKMAAAYRRS